MLLLWKPLAPEGAPKQPVQNPGPASACHYWPARPPCVQFSFATYYLPPTSKAPPDEQHVLFRDFRLLVNTNSLPSPTPQPTLPPAPAAEAATSPPADQQQQQQPPPEQQPAPSPAAQR